MKNILSFILLLGALCLAGCSEEIPQNVFFDKEEATVTSFENSVNVGVSADCKWNIQVTSGNPTVSVMSGEGQAFITVTVRKNKTYEGIDHTIVITSENGKSSDSFTIHQWPLLETTADSPLVSCEGGSFDVNVKSSDTFSNVETPDWITFTSSRAMKDYVYSFTAEPNKTGKPRTGSVWLKGMLIHEEIVVKQDSYAPTGVVVNGAPEKTIKSELSLNIQLEPEYADWNKLALVGENCNASIANKILSIKTDEYGTSSVRFTSNGEDIGTLSFEYCKPEVIIKDSIPTKTTLNKFSTAIQLYPEITEFSDISVEGSGCDVYLNDNILTVVPKEYGKNYVYFTHDDNTVKTISFEFFPINPLAQTSITTFLNDIYSIGWKYYSEDYQITSENEDVVEIMPNGKIKMAGLGKATVRVFNPVSKTYSDLQVKVEPFLAYSNILWLTKIGTGKIEVAFTTNIKCYYQYPLYRYYFIRDPNGTIIYQGAIEGNLYNRTIKTPRIELTYDHNKFSDPRDAMKGYQIIVGVEIEGSIYQLEVDIDHMNIG